jgi:hypothetical protein
VGFGPVSWDAKIDRKGLVELMMVVVSAVFCVNADGIDGLVVDLWTGVPLRSLTVTRSRNTSV